MVVRPGKNKPVETKKRVVVPRNKVFVVVGRELALKGKVKRGSP